VYEARTSSGNCADCQLMRCGRLCHTWYLCGEAQIRDHPLLAPSLVPELSNLLDAPALLGCTCAVALVIVADIYAVERVVCQDVVAKLLIQGPFQHLCASLDEADEVFRGLDGRQLLVCKSLERIVLVRARGCAVVRGLLRGLDLVLNLSAQLAADLLVALLLPPALPLAPGRACWALVALVAL